MTDTSPMSNKNDSSLSALERDGWALEIPGEPVIPLEVEQVRGIALLGVESGDTSDPSEGEVDFAVLHAPEGTPDLVARTVARGIVEAIRRAVKDVSDEVNTASAIAGDSASDTAGDSASDTAGDSAVDAESAIAAASDPE